MAGRKITAEHDEVPEKAPSDSTLLDGKDIPLCEGLYVITNKISRTTVDLPNSSGGTRCHGHSQVLTGDFGDQLWMVQRSGPSSDTFTLQSFEHLVFLEVSDGKVDNGAIVVGRTRTEVAENRSNQEWSIAVEPETIFHTMQCARTRTFLEILNGNSSDCAAITCSAKAAKRDYQLWDLNRVSRSGEEIKAIIESWRPDLLGRLLELHESAEYFILPGQLRNEIWDGTKLLRQPVRPHLFDYDDFVIKSRDAVKTWARDRFSVDREGYCVLFGLIFGKAKRGPNAYNWYLGPDMRSLVFFDAQTGKEYSTAALDEFEFKPTFATF